MIAKTEKERVNRRKKKVSACDTQSVALSPGGDFRTRVQAVAAIVHAAFGIDPETHPVCDARDAYRVVISLIIEVLVTDGERVSTGELTVMSKLLAEHRRLDIAEMEAEGKYGKEVSHDDTSEEQSADTRPTGLGRAVKDIYGTNLDG